MFFALSKILSFLMHPLFWIVFLIFLGWLTKKPIRKKRLFISAAVAMLFFTNTVIFLELTRMYEPFGKKIEEVGNYDVAIVLGGMAEYDNNLKRLSLRRGGDRIWQALHLYEIGKVKKLMIVGANGSLTDSPLNEAVQFRDVLLDFGVPDEDIIIEVNSKNTYENAVESKKILDKRSDLSSYLLVTSALHMPRSEACFKKAGFKNFDVFTTDHFTGEKRGYGLEQYFVPNLSLMTDWYKLNHEWVGYFTYWVMGYV